MKNDIEKIVSNASPKQIVEMMGYALKIEPEGEEDWLIKTMQSEPESEQEAFIELYKGLLYK